MMYEKILDDLYRIEVPLPNNPLRALNAYLIRGKDRNLLVDNGFNMDECENALRAALEALGADLERTDFFITHLHSDHNGLTSRLYTPGVSTIYSGRKDGSAVNDALNEKHWESMFFFMRAHGFPAREAQRIAATHPGRIYAPGGPFDFAWVDDGGRIEVGRFSFTAIETPGHTPGHMTLFENGTGTYISGDHILGAITPNITHWDGVKDSLGDYLASLDKTAALAPELTLPAHRALVTDTQKRIAQLKGHHELRLAEAAGLLKKHGPMDAYVLASRMRWSIRADTWEKFPVQQRWFASGEALAHLERLENIGQARREMSPDGIISFMLA